MAVSATTTDLGAGVYQIDTLMSGYSGITAGYLVLGERPCLVETGTARSAPVVRAALTALGVGPETWRRSWSPTSTSTTPAASATSPRRTRAPRSSCTRRAPGTSSTPARLMDSARRVYGSLMDDVFGLLQPTDRSPGARGRGHRRIDLGGGRRCGPFYSPGHAKHHLGLLDSTPATSMSATRRASTSRSADVLGPRLRPRTSTSTSRSQSLSLFASVAPRRLLFSHYGPVTDVAGTLDRSAEELRLWVELVRTARSDRLDLDHAVAMVRERTAERYAAVRDDPELEEKFEGLNSIAANLVGINRWLDRVDGTAHDFGDPSAVSGPRPPIG